MYKCGEHGTIMEQYWNMNSDWEVTPQSNVVWKSMNEVI